MKLAKKTKLLSVVGVVLAASFGVVYAQTSTTEPSEALKNIAENPKGLVNGISPEQRAELERSLSAPILGPVVSKTELDALDAETAALVAALDHSGVDGVQNPSPYELSFPTATGEIGFAGANTVYDLPGIPQRVRFLRFSTPTSNPTVHISYVDCAGKVAIDGTPPCDLNTVVWNNVPIPSPNANLKLDDERLQTVLFPLFDATTNELVWQFNIETLAFTRNIAPVVSCASPGTGWLNVDVTIACTATDADGLDNPATDASFQLTTAVPIGTETAAATTNSRQVCDTTGLCATGGPITGLKVDRKAPSAIVTTPAQSASYAFNELVSADYACTDTGSGIAATGGCVGSVPIGSPIDTNSPGAKAFTVTAKDDAGNTTTVSANYVVLPPIIPSISVKADYGANIRDVGFPTPAATIWGTFATTTPGPYTSAVQWKTGGVWTPFVLNNASQFVALNVYLTNGTYSATVRICGAGNICGTDVVTIRVGVPKPLPIAQCVIDRGITITPRYQARFGYSNTGTVPVIAPVPLVNFFAPAPVARSQTQVLLPGSNNAITTDFVNNGTVSWSIYGNTATAKPTTVRC
jgi:hypothetical protein